MNNEEKFIIVFRRKGQETFVKKEFKNKIEYENFIKDNNESFIELIKLYPKDNL